jgi:hypothetical protein
VRGDGRRRVASQIPAGAAVSQAQHKITFSGGSVRLTIVATHPAARMKPSAPRDW